MIPTHRIASGPRRLARGVLAALLVASPAVPAQLNCDAGIDFHANGGIKRCILNGHHRLGAGRQETGGHQLLSCASGQPATLHPDGQLASCTLREDARLDGRRCAAGAPVNLDREGRLLECGRG